MVYSFKELIHDNDFLTLKGNRYLLSDLHVIPEDRQPNVYNVINGNQLLCQFVVSPDEIYDFYKFHKLIRTKKEHEERF